MTSASNLEKLRKDFEFFCNECMDLCFTVQTFDTLFGTPQSQDLLRASAQVFFDHLHGLYLHAYFLQAARLLDDEGKGTNRNLTVEYFASALQREGAHTSSILGLAKKLNLYRALISKARSKYIAHIDLRFARNPKTLGAHKKEEMDDFISSLQSYTDEVGIALGAGPLDYTYQGGAGGAQDLLQILKRGVAVKEI